MGEVEIRRARASDSANVAQLLSATFYQYRGLRSLLTPILRIGLCYDLAARLQSSSKAHQYQCLVAEAPHPTQANLKVLVGTVEVGLRPLTLPSQLLARKAYISNLAVQQNYRQQGIGQKLLRQCEAVAQSWEQSEIFLHVRQENAIAQSLYQKLGYEPPLHRSPLERQRSLLMKKLSVKF